MGAAYTELLQDPDLLQVQLHGFAAAASDADIARGCREGLQMLWHVVDDRSGYERGRAAASSSPWGCC